MDKTSPAGFFEKLPGFILLAVISLLPIFFLPGGGVSLDFAKTSLLVAATALTLIFWFAVAIRRGEIIIPKNPVIISALFIAISAAASSVLSPAVRTSFWGAGFETDTALAVISLAALLFLSAALFKDREKVILLFSLLALSSVLIFFFQIFKIFIAPDSAIFGLFSQKTANLVGKWNDLSVLSGFQAIVSLLILEFFALKKSFRIAVYAIFFLSLFFLSLTNFYLGWVLFAASALFVVVYYFSFGGESMPSPERFNQRKISRLGIFSIALATLFLLPQSFLGSFLAKSFGIYSVEVKPSWSATMNVAASSLKENPFFGAGPNRFQNEWLRFKPEVVNNTLFWNTAFDSGSGAIPTSAITQGLLGVISWIALIFFFLYYGLKSIFNPAKDKIFNFLSLVSFAGAAYLFAAAFFYSPGVVNLGLAFSLLGVFAAVSASGGIFGEFKVNFSKSPTLSFVSVLVFMVAIVALIYVIYAVSSRTLAAREVGQIVLPLETAESINNAETRTLKALSFYESDYFYRILSDVNLAKIAFVSRNAKSLSDADTAALQTVLKTAIETAQKAVAFDQTKAGNWLTLSRIYGDLVPLGVEGAYESAVSSYNKSLELSPKDPTIYFSLGKIEAARGDAAAAKSYLNRALELKTNYTEAASMLSGILAAEGKTEEAVAVIKKFAAENQNDPAVFYQLGLIEYSAGRYGDAALALARAVAINPSYSDAKFLLGLSYQKLGRIVEAISELEGVLSLNPDNQEVKNILDPLKTPKP